MKSIRSLIIIALLLLCSCVDTVFDGADFIKTSSQQHLAEKMGEKGNVEEQYKAGLLYCCGDSATKDTLRALYWFCKAAKNNQRDALYSVARIYENPQTEEGSIIPVNRALSYVYYTRAELEGHMQARQMRDMLSAHMSREERALAQRYAENWPNVACAISRRKRHKSPKQEWQLPHSTMPPGKAPDEKEYDEPEYIPIPQEGLEQKPKKGQKEEKLKGRSTDDISNNDT